MIDNARTVCKINVGGKFIYKMCANFVAREKAFTERLETLVANRKEKGIKNTMVMDAERYLAIINSLRANLSGNSINILQGYLDIFLTFVCREMFGGLLQPKSLRFGHRLGQRRTGL